MNTIRQLVKDWWCNVTYSKVTELLNQYYPNKIINDKEIENIFYNEVIRLWWLSLPITKRDELHNHSWPPSEQEIKEIYLKEHSKEEPKSKLGELYVFQKGELNVVAGSPLHNALKDLPICKKEQPLSVNKDVEVDEETLESKVRNLFSPIKNYIAASRCLFEDFDQNGDIKKSPKALAQLKILNEEGLKADQNIYAIISEIHNASQPKVEDNSWDEVAKILSNTKYRLPISKDDTAVYVVDIPKAIEYLKQNYLLIKNENYEN